MGVKGHIGRRLQAHGMIFPYPKSVLLLNFNPSAVALILQNFQDSRKCGIKIGQIAVLGSVGRICYLNGFIEFLGKSWQCACVVNTEAMGAAQ